MARIREADAIGNGFFPGIPADIVLDSLNNALTNDPGSANLLFNAIIQQLRLGRFDEAQALYARMERIGPRMAKTGEAARLLEAIRERMSP